MVLKEERIIYIKIKGIYEIKPIYVFYENK